MLKDIQVQNQKETRGGFGEGIYEVGKANKDIVVLTADLAGSLKLGPFMKEFS
jgi:transketolase